MTNRPTSPEEPTKKHPPPIQPNAHPYAIKTTSSALLSRSNSSPHSAHHIKHHYIPLALSQIPSGARVRHRHSSSLPLVEGGVRTIPAPLPTPPPVAVASPDGPSVSLKRTDEPKLTHRTRRAGTMPSSATEPTTEHHSYDRKHGSSYDQESGPELYAGLPPNPKQWSTDELATYLEASFRPNNIDGDRHDSSLVDILECVRARGLTGRELLRLTDGDLAGTSLSDAQRAQLLERSRALRADVLRGRIYVDSYHSHEVSDNSNDIYSRSAHSCTPFHSIRGASVSVDNLHLLLDNNTAEGESAFPPSPAMSLRRSNSVSDASAERYRDLARIRMRRRGRVKGLVETWERASTSGSECSTSEESSVSASEAESESETDPEFQSTLDANHSPESSSDLLSAPHDEPQLNVYSPMTNSSIVLHATPSLTPPPPYTHMNATPGVGDEEEEPSIEELLASSSSIPLRGGRAWEADFGLGETVKRIPVCVSTDAGGASPSVMESDSSPKDDGQQTKGDSVWSKGSGVRRSTGSRRKNAKSQNRVVTAIFTGSPPDHASENAGDVVHSADRHRHASGTNGVVRGEASASSDLQNGSDSALRALEESIATTRAQMGAFKLRLEEVEADTARQEAVLIHAQLSDPHHTSEFELMRRRSEASKQVTAETVEPPRDETLVNGVRNRDALEGWETTSLIDIARAVVAKAMGWVFPYGHLGAHAPEDPDRFQAPTGSRPGANDRDSSPAKREGRLSLARTSCSIILVSFAICAAVLRRMGFGRWVRRP